MNFWLDLKDSSWAPVFQSVACRRAKVRQGGDGVIVVVVGGRDLLVDVREAAVAHGRDVGQATLLQRPGCWWVGLKRKPKELDTVKSSNHRCNASLRESNTSDLAKGPRTS